MSKGTITDKILETHLVSDALGVEDEIALRVDQTLTQDATGTLVMQELELIGLERPKTEVSVQYVDHNMLQNDFRNPDDHLFLQTFAKKNGIWFSPAGNGISHPLQMSKFLKPGQVLVGSDSHTCASGGIGAIAFGMGGLDVAHAMAGFPVYIRRPKVLGVNLHGRLPDWVSAKDVALAMLRKYDVNGLRNFIIEYYGEGVDQLSAMDRHVICNMAVETGATCGIFPSDRRTKEFMEQHRRGSEWFELTADRDCTYDEVYDLDLSTLVPLIARPSSPGNVVEVREVIGEPIYQAYIGSSANPGFRDYAVCAEMVAGKYVKQGVSFDINPSTREVLDNLMATGHMSKLIEAGARLHQAGCNGCIGMGQAPATGRNSLRTVPRNFKGRSGTAEDAVWLCSPETATASALNGFITDPRDMQMDYPRIEEPRNWKCNTNMFVPPAVEKQEIEKIEVVRGPNIKILPILPALSSRIEVPVIAKFGDNISTDDILPAGSRILPYRSNLQELAKFTFNYVNNDYYALTLQERFHQGHIIIAGSNYGQGSSREHAALAPRYLGLKAIIAKSYARIHRQNLINFGVIPFEFELQSDYDRVEFGDLLKIENIYHLLEGKETLEVDLHGRPLKLFCRLTPRQREILRHGGLLNYSKHHLEAGLK